MKKETRKNSEGVCPPETLEKVIFASKYAARLICSGLNWNVESKIQQLSTLMSDNSGTENLVKLVNPIKNYRSLW